MPTKQEVAIFEMPTLPKEYQAFLETETNIVPRDTTPTLNPGGKRWTIAIDGESVVLKKPDPDNEGETVPLQIFRGFVVAHSTKRGRTYYESKFDDKKPGRPTCWSEDNITPDPRVPAADRQHKVCNGCPQQAKGSAVSDDGRETKACKEHQLIALLPSNRIDGDFPALRLKLSITSIYDGKDQAHEEQDWYAWGPYLQHLMARIPQNAHTARVETLIKFDTTVQYPKLLFKAKRGVTTEEYIKLVDFMRANKDRLAALVNSLMSQNAPLPPKANDPDEDEPAPKKTKANDPDEEEVAPKPSPKPTRKPVVDEEEEVAPKPKPKPKPAAAEDDEEVAPKPKPKPKPVDPDDDAEVPPGMRKKRPVEPDEIVMPPKKLKPAEDETETAPKPKAKGNIKDLLSEWA